MNFPLDSVTDLPDDHRQALAATLEHMQVRDRSVSACNQLQCRQDVTMASHEALLAIPICIQSEDVQQPGGALLQGVHRGHAQQVSQLQRREGVLFLHCDPVNRRTEAGAVFWGLAYDVEASLLLMILLHNNGPDAVRGQVL